MIEVFVGSGLGGVIRYFVGILISKFFHATWLATLLVNVVGSLSILFLANKVSIGDERLSRFLIVGLLGGFTTFSSFSNEVFQKISDGNYGVALMIIALNIFLGIFVGVLIFR